MWKNMFALSAILAALTNAAFGANATFSCEMIKDKKTRLSCIDSATRKQIDPAIQARKDFVHLSKKLVSDRMLDPAAAQFKEVTYIESDLQEGDEPTRHVVCGMVNGKNSYGGYVGFTTFWVDAGTSGSPIVNVCSSDSAAKEACLMGADIYCTKAVRKSILEERM